LPSEIQAPSITDFILDENGVSTTAFHTWMAQITDAVSPPLTGSGSPEGVIIASAGRWYVDTASAAGTGIYFKQSGEGNTGWVARS